MSLHCSLFKFFPWSASSSSPDDKPHLLVRNASAKNFSYVISIKRLCLIHYGSQKLEYRNYYSPLKPPQKASIWKNLWQTNVIPKVNTFYWLLFHKKNIDLWKSKEKMHSRPFFFPLMLTNVLKFVAMVNLHNVSFVLEMMKYNLYL